MAGTRVNGGGSHELPPGYFFVVDPEGAEVPGSRRYVDGTDIAKERAIKQELKARMGEGCSVEFPEK